MNDPPSKFQILVALKRANDLDLAFEAALFSQAGFTLADRPMVEAIIKELDRLVDGFDYLESLEFLSSIEGKSQQFRTMKRKLHTPAKLAAQRTRFLQLLSDDLYGDEVAELLPPEKHEYLSRLRQLAAAIA